MKIVVQVKLAPTPEQAAALTATLRACNAAADRVSAVAFERGVFTRNDLQKITYGEVKTCFALSAQPAVRVIKKVVDAYTALHAGIQAGRLGPQGSPRRAKAEGKPIRFRRDAAQPFDDRCLSWHPEALTVSIWTVHGRLKDVPYTGAAGQLNTLTEHRRGESDLVHRDGMWLLAATCEVPQAPLNTDPADWIGVDRGVVNLATTSDGDNHQGRRLARYRRWHARKRAELQARQTRSATRRAKRRAKREARHATPINHRISKQIVAVAERTGRGIALEQLDGIRDRVRLRGDQRATLSCWPFHQLGQFIGYKARRAGVPLIEVDPAYTSQTCPRCGHVAKTNRATRDNFACRRCGLAGPADLVAAVNVRARARRAWVFVNAPAPHRT